MTRSNYYQKVAATISRDSGFPLATVRPSAVVEDTGHGATASGVVDVTDVLPQLEEPIVERYLGQLAASGTRVLVVVSTQFSDVVLEDGSNQSKTVQSARWWLELLRKHFNKVVVLPAYQDSDIAATNFALDGKVETQLESLVPGSSLRKEATRLFVRSALAARRILGWTVGQNRLFRDLEGKSVALVGNARSLGGSSHGQQIDRHDVVIRFNRVPILNRRSHGYKTTWVATGVPQTQSRLTELGASRLLWLSPFRRKISAETIAIRGLYVHPLQDFQTLGEDAHVDRPSTGLVAIDLLQRSPCASVSLYGFDFYSSQSSSSHQTVETAPHQFDREEVYVQRLLQADLRFSLIR